MPVCSSGQTDIPSSHTSSHSPQREGDVFSKSGHRPANDPALSFWHPQQKRTAIAVHRVSTRVAHLIQRSLKGNLENRPGREEILAPFFIAVESSAWTKPLRRMSRKSASFSAPSSSLFLRQTGGEEEVRALLGSKAAAQAPELLTPSSATGLSSSPAIRNLPNPALVFPPGR